MTQVKYDPELWLETTSRAIQTYVEDALTGAYDEAFQIVMGFPGTELDTSKVPMTKTIVHFEIDDITDRPLGFGENIMAQNYSVDDQANYPQEARVHVINFDVGIWASARSGGTTARMRLRQLLTNLFCGALALENFRAVTDGGDGGVEIRSFSGGRFVNDTINDTLVYRLVNGELVVRVYSRTPMPSSETATATIEEIDQSEALTIDA